MSYSREQDKYRTFGRAKGRALKPHIQAVWDENFPRLSWDADVPLPTDKPLWLEIGFGGAEHMLWQAAQNSDVHIIGAEPFLNGVAKAVRGAAQDGLTNLTLQHGDVRDVLATLPDASLSRAFILFPDPWPKSRHNKRRLLRTKFIAELHRVLKPGAELRFASDINHYVDWTLTRMHRHGGWDWTAESHADWTVRPDDWPGTRYEAKAIREGRVPQYFKFIKLDPAQKASS